jgi:hypothetical protein
LYSIGHPREALAEAQKQLAFLPQKSKSVLSANFESVELLERMRVYAAGLDDAACAFATDRLVRIWDDMRSTYPESRFVLEQAERIHALRQKPCAPQAIFQVYFPGSVY